MDIRNGRFVVTGGASLIGSHVADRLLAEGAAQVVLLDNFSLGTPQAIAHLDGNPRVSLVRGDILRVGELFDAFAGADGVFAIAGFLTLPLTQNPPLGLAVNVDGMVNVFEAYVLNDVFLRDLDRQLVVNYNDQKTRVTGGFPGMKVGDVKVPNNNAGN